MIFEPIRPLYYWPSLDADYTTAVLLLKSDDPLPLDLEARLMLSGVDVAALREKYTPQ